MIERCTKSDFDFILTNYSRFWDHERGKPLHHPIFIREFGDTAFVVREAGRVVAYLFGFLSQTEPTGYVQFIAVDRDYRGRGLGRRLYERFIEVVRQRGCRTIRAIAVATNRDSIAFHKKLGMRLLGEPGPEGVPVVRDYSGPGLNRVVFEMAIDTVAGRSGAEVGNAQLPRVPSLGYTVRLEIGHDKHR